MTITFILNLFNMISVPYTYFLFTLIFYLFLSGYQFESAFIGELCQPLLYEPVSPFCIGCITYTFDGLGYNPVIALPRLETGVLIENKISVLSKYKDECKLINEIPVRCFETGGANINNIRFELGGIDNQQLTIHQITPEAYSQLLNQTIYLQCSRDFYSFNFCILIHFVQVCPSKIIYTIPDESNTVIPSNSTKSNNSIIELEPTTHLTEFILFGIIGTVIACCFLLVGCFFIIFIIYKICTKESNTSNSKNIDPSLALQMHSNNSHKNENDLKRNELYEAASPGSLLRMFRPRSIDNNYKNGNTNPGSLPFVRLFENLDAFDSDILILLYIMEHYPAIIVPTTEERSYLFTTSSTDALNQIDFDCNEFFTAQHTFWTPGKTEEALYFQFSTFKFREIFSQHVHKGDLIGEGEFGKIHKGQWLTMQGCSSIAIKTIKSLEKADIILLLQEAAIMGQFCHPNIVQLIGLTTLTEPPMIIMEFMDNGDLDNYLNDILDPQRIVSHHPFFLRASIEVATGMKYLSEKCFVHRDLAARNIFLDNLLMCKIGDFGMSKKISKMEAYYIPNDSISVPVKWTAPEALSEQKYSEASDVWSYGCLLYEIWSCGKKPWSSLTNITTIIEVLSGNKLKSPIHCPQSISFLINNCCENEKQLRKKFTDILLYLQYEVD